MKTSKKITAVLSVLATVVMVQTSGAVNATYNLDASHSASADFSISGSTLTITLENTGIAARNPIDVLTGLGFNVPAGVTLTPNNATYSGSIDYGTLVNNVGEGWEYRSGISFYNANAGISTAGLNIFGPDGNFYSPGVKVGGLDYGIANGFNNPTQGLQNQGPLVNGTMTFSLGISGSGLTASGLADSAVFNWGTDLRSVPDGGMTIAFLGLVLSGLGWFRYRVKQA